MGLGFRKDEYAKGKVSESLLNNQPDIRILARHLEQMEILGRGKAALDIY